MTMTKDRFGGLLFLLLCLTYGYYAGDIPMLPRDEFEPFNAQTMPNWLAGLGIFLALLMIFSKGSSSVKNEPLLAANVGIMLGLLSFTFLLSLALPWFGFPVTTSLFLIASYRLLGERRPKMLLLASVPFALALWLLLTQVLEVYIAPARLALW
jgi:putative tricarboxylic transport membrane protein